MYNYGIWSFFKKKEICYQKKENMMKLLKYLKKVLNYFLNKNNLKQPKVISCCGLKGMVLTRQEKYEEAVDFFKKALILDPNSASANYGVG